MLYFCKFANKSNIQETCCSKKKLLSRVDNYFLLLLANSPKFYCCHFNDKAVPWASPLEFVCRSSNESGVQCVNNGAEHSSS